MWLGMCKFIQKFQSIWVWSDTSEHVKSNSQYYMQYVKTKLSYDAGFLHMHRPP